MILQRLLSSILSCLTIIPVYFLCKRFFNNPFPIIGSFIFAFEPRLILNSVLGITEPLFILLTTSAIVAILNSKRHMNYVAFFLAAFSVLIRSEGLILFVAFSVLFLVTNRKNKKTLLHYPILCLIFVLILIPIAAYNIGVTGHDGFLSRVVYETSQINTIDKEVTSQSSSPDFVGRTENFLKMYGWALIPTFILFIPFGLFYVIRSHKFDDFALITLLGIMMIPVIYALSFISDPRYSYFTFPILIVISLFTIKNISNKINRNLFLIIIIGGVIISSSIFIEFKKTDVSYENEAFELAHYVAESTKIINQYIPNSGYLPNVGLEMLEDFPILRKDFEQKSNLEYCVNVHSCSSIIPVNSDKIEDFIEYGRTKGLTHIVIDENYSKKEKFMGDIFNNEGDFSYLKKEFDSVEEGFSHHLKIFEIDFEKFDAIK